MAIIYRPNVRLALLATAVAGAVVGGVYLWANIASAAEFDGVSPVPESVAGEADGVGGERLDWPTAGAPAVKIYRATPGTNSPAPAHH